MTKQQITERQAVVQFTKSMIAHSMGAWQEICKNVGKVFPNESRFRAENEEQAVFDLMLAASALDLQAVRTLFSTAQAIRLEALVYELGVSNKYGDYEKREKEGFSQDLQKEVGQAEKGGNPLGIISALLLQRWLGDDLKHFSVQGTREETISPGLVDAVTAVLFSPSSGMGTWKLLSEKFDLVDDPSP